MELKLEIEANRKSDSYINDGKLIISMDSSDDSEIRIAFSNYTLDIDKNEFKKYFSVFLD